MAYNIASDTIIDGTITASNISGTTSGTNTGDEATMTNLVGGLVPTPPNDAAKFLNGTGTFTTPSGAALSDANYGDVVVSGAGTVMTINTGVVSNSKLANMATQTIKGRTTAGTGVPEDLTAAQVITVLGLDTITDATFTQPSASTAWILVHSRIVKANIAFYNAAGFREYPIEDHTVSTQVTATFATSEIHTAVVMGSGFATNASVDTDATMAANSDTVVASQKATKTALALKASLTGAETLTNKRITKRVSSEASNAAPSINSDNIDAHRITALAAPMTSFTVTGTPTDFQFLNISITDNGTARALTFGSDFEASGSVALPTTTVISTRMDLGFIRNTVTNKWRIVANA